MRDPDNTEWRDITANSFITASSRDLKRDIVPVDSLGLLGWLKTLNEMQPATYRWKSQGTPRQRLGFIADELPEVLRSSDGKGVDIYALSTAVAAGLRGLWYRSLERNADLESRLLDQASRIAEQEEELRILRREVQEVEAALARIESRRK